MNDDNDQDRNPDTLGRTDGNKRGNSYLVHSARTGGPRGGHKGRHKGERRPVGKISVYTKTPKGVMIRTERANRMVARYMGAFPWLTTADRDLLRVHCMIHLLMEECYSKISTEGLVNQRGTPHVLLDDFRSLARTMAFTASRLALAPVDRAAMLSSKSHAILNLEGLDLRGVNRVLRQRGNGDQLTVSRPKPADPLDNNQDVERETQPAEGD
jgi:hypothetical protein